MLPKGDLSSPPSWTLIPDLLTILQEVTVTDWTDAQLIAPVECKNRQMVKQHAHQAY